MRHREEVFAHLNSWLERLDVTLEERSGLPFGFGLEKDLLEELSKEAEVLADFVGIVSAPTAFSNDA